jgi:hypothetical protein
MGSCCTHTDIVTTSLEYHSLCDCFLQHVTMEDSYLCGYLKIKGLTEVKWSRTGSDTVYIYLTPHMQ